MKYSKPEIREEVRENWGSRAGFVLAAVGSAVGLGNLWGFPYKLYSYGGGAFLIPYILAMFVIGIPLMILEFSIGHKFQKAAPDAFAQANRHFETVGWWGVLLGFVIITYYPVILAYCFNFLWFSVKGIFDGGHLPWAGENIAGVKKATSFFFDSYLGYHESLSLGNIRVNIVLTLVISWIAMYLCIFKGVNLVGKVVWLTVPLPWIMLAILAVRGLTLPGAVKGIAYYLEPDWSRLAEPATWKWAFGQVFFSMSLAFGVMVTYASFLHRKSDINNNAAIIGLADFGTSFICGLAVFATLGGMAYATQMSGNPVPVAEVAKEGPSLAFVAFPYALAQLPYSAWFSAVFFITLITLGLDSAFSITETVLASIVDKTGWKRSRVLIVMSLVGLLVGIIYCTNGGLNWVGIIDGIINGTWGIALLGLLECLILGWLFNTGVLREHANERSDWSIGIWWDIIIRVVIPVILSALFIWSLFDDITKGSGLFHDADGSISFAAIVGLSIALIVPAVSLVLTYKEHVKRKKDHKQNIYLGKTEHAMLGKKIFSAVFFMVVLALIAFVRIVCLKNAGGSSDTKGTQVLLLCVISAVVSAALLIVSGSKVFKCEKSNKNPSFWLRSSAALSTFCVGFSLGISLAFITMHAEKAVKKEMALSATSMVILAIIGFLVFGGLTWCFIKAIGSAPGGKKIRRSGKK
ncbi:MAG: sodium-dependent transporter [bacterium]|nr:sodium-dependent transporter [bacterium]